MRGSVSFLVPSTVLVVSSLFSTFFSNFLRVKLTDESDFSMGRWWVRGAGPPPAGVTVVVPMAGSNEAFLLGPDFTSPPNCRGFFEDVPPPPPPPPLSCGNGLVVSLGLADLATSSAECFLSTATPAGLAVNWLFLLSRPLGPRLLLDLTATLVLLLSTTTTSTFAPWLAVVASPSCCCSGCSSGCCCLSTEAFFVALFGFRSTTVDFFCATALLLLERVVATGAVAGCPCC